MWTGMSERSPDRQKLHGEKKKILGWFHVKKRYGRHVPSQTAQGDIQHGQHAAGHAWVKALKHENSAGFRG